MKKLIFISQSLISHLSNAAKEIQNSPDLEPQDIPALAAQVTAVDSAFMAQTANIIAGHSQPLTDEQKSDKPSQIPKTEKPGKSAGLKVAAAAKYLGISKNKLRELSDLGKIPCKKLDGVRYFSIEDLDNWIAALSTWVEGNETQKA